MSDTQVLRKPMFGRSEAQPGNDVLAERDAVSFKEVPQAARTEPRSAANASGTAGSVIGESLTFKGELSAGEDLIIEGTVEGKINQGKCSLTLRPNGRILADVNATRIFIDGTVQGDLRASESVTIRESGKVTGNIVAPRIAIEEGAIFNGTVEMRDPAQKD